MFKRRHTFTWEFFYILSLNSYLFFPINFKNFFFRQIHISLSYFFYNFLELRLAPFPLYLYIFIFFFFRIFLKFKLLKKKNLLKWQKRKYCLFIFYISNSLQFIYYIIDFFFFWIFYNIFYLKKMVCRYYLSSVCVVIFFFDISSLPYLQEIKFNKIQHKFFLNKKFLLRFSFFFNNKNNSFFSSFFLSNLFWNLRHITEKFFNEKKIFTT